MDFLTELKWRNLVHQTTDDQLGPWLAEKSRIVYAGFDPTAESLHVGHLLPLSMLRRFQHAGHKPIALVGGATGMIGDPSGKSAERNLLSRETLESNVAGMKSQMERLLRFDDSPTSAELVNNIDWIGKFNYIDFLRDVGKNSPVNVMMAKESVKARLERDDVGLSYTEFSYMLLQAYDFVHLYRQHGCELQIGGSDQWGNITAGIDLARRMEGAHLRGLTCPLLTKADGTKMGKTESGAVWLSAERTSPYKFYQYWLNVDDADAGGCLRMLTELSPQEIESLDTQRREAPERRESQRRLAESLTQLIHGETGLAAAQRATEIFFGGEIDNLNDQQLNEIFTDVPSHQMPRGVLSEGLDIADALVASGLSKSKGEARRTIEQGGAYVNNRRVPQPTTILTATDLASESVMVLRTGRKNYALLKFG